MNASVVCWFSQPTGHTAEGLPGGARGWQWTEIRIWFAKIPKTHYSSNSTEQLNFDRSITDSDSSENKTLSLKITLKALGKKRHQPNKPRKSLRFFLHFSLEKKKMVNQMQKFIIWKGRSGKLESAVSVSFMASTRAFCYFIHWAEVVVVFQYKMVWHNTILRQTALPLSPATSPIAFSPVFPAISIYRMMRLIRFAAD